eukprot:5194145-Ditylum_brightwellii.AAC.1
MIQKGTLTSICSRTRFDCQREYGIIEERQRAEHKINLMKVWGDWCDPKVYVQTGFIGDHYLIESVPIASWTIVIYIITRFLDLSIWKMIREKMEG